MLLKTALSYKYYIPYLSWTNFDYYKALFMLSLHDEKSWSEMPRGRYLQVLKEKR